MASLRGKLLIASPALVDPNFARTVVLIAEHSDDGAMGLVLNRPSDATVSEAIDELAGLVDSGDPVFVGGPVQAESVMVLAEFDEPELAAAIVFDDIGFLPADGDLGTIAGHVLRTRVFAGHSGWGPGQLDAELEEGSWIVGELQAGEVFAEASDELWPVALERKGGPYALLARIPEDPSVN
jgi:putative transcriptional regulator